MDRRVGRVGLGLGRASGVVVVPLRQLLLHLVAPRPSSIVQRRRGRATVVVVVVVAPLLPRPLPLLVAVQILGRGTLGVAGPILAQQSAYAERVAPGRLGVLQRSRVGLTRGRGIGALGVVQAAILVGVIAGAATSRVGVVHVDLFRRVHVAVAVNRHDRSRIQSGQIRAFNRSPFPESCVHRKLLRMLILRLCLATFSPSSIRLLRD